MRSAAPPLQPLTVRTSRPRAPFLGAVDLRINLSGPQATPISRQVDGLTAIASRQHSVRPFDAMSGSYRATQTVESFSRTVEVLTVVLTVDSVKK